MSTARHKRTVLFVNVVDPRQWTRSDVVTWLRVHQSQLDVDVSARFPMNGRALCIMTPAMFRHRVGDAQGAALFSDFRNRLLAAVDARSTST